MEDRYEKDQMDTSLMAEFQPSGMSQEPSLGLRSGHSRSYKVAFVLAITNLATVVALLISWGRGNVSSCGNDLDPWGNKIPYKDVVWEEDSRYVDSNPKVFYNQTSGDEHSIWGRIFPSAWVELIDGSKVGGAYLKEWGSDKDEWDDESQVWPVTLMHQIHCLATMKTSYQLLEEGEYMNEERLSHFPHCIEYLRQSVLCQADLTLENTMLPHKWPLGTTGWGTTHKCRDLDAVMATITEHSVLRGQREWVRMSEQDKASWLSERKAG